MDIKTEYPDIKERGATEYLRALAELEMSGAGEVIGLEMGMYSLFTVIGAVQLALRNPHLAEESPGVAQHLREVVEILREPFRDTPAWEIIQTGDNPDFDR
jgi:hypothetical protein